MSYQLIDTARMLARTGRRRPRQADLQRAVSTAYYALFHAFARNGADMLVGSGQNRSEKAWVQVYRALDHGFAKKACARALDLGFPQPLLACADAFIQLQEERHNADYDPSYRVSRAGALALVSAAEAAIAALGTADRKDRLAFAVHVLLKQR